jgi:hypothetical protein
VRSGDRVRDRPAVGGHVQPPASQFPAQRCLSAVARPEGAPEAHPLEARERLPAGAARRIRRRGAGPRRGCARAGSRRSRGSLASRAGACVSARCRTYALQVVQQHPGGRWPRVTRRNTPAARKLRWKYHRSTCAGRHASQPRSHPFQSPTCLVNGLAFPPASSLTPPIKCSKTTQH